MGLFFGESVPSDLRDYVNAPDPSFQWQVAGRTPEFEMLSLTSLSWHEVEWVHSLAVTLGGSSHDTAVLYVTGGEPNPTDLADARLVAERSGLTTAMLFNIPNQPLFDREEDELIAFTFERFLDDGDPSWPLLLPMAKSVIRAMDVLQTWSRGTLKRFVLMGESKRAWTGWMAAASGDSRIIGIVPTVFDNLNFGPQLQHQFDIWDQLSTSIHDYTDLGLQDRLDTQRGMHLAKVVDPFTYLPKLETRVFQVHGSNDPYWAPDARALYADALPLGASLLTLPNEGHVFSGKADYYRVAGAFARTCTLNAEWPSIKAKLVERSELFVKLIISADSQAICSHCRLYVAESESGEFTDSVWKMESQCGPPETLEFRFALPGFESAFQAAFVQADFELDLGRETEKITLSGSTILRRR